MTGLEMRKKQAQNIIYKQEAFEIHSTESKDQAAHQKRFSRPSRILFCVLTGYLAGIVFGVLFPYWGKNNYKEILEYVQGYAETWLNAGSAEKLLAIQLSTLLSSLCLIGVFGCCAVGFPLLLLISASCGAWNGAVYTAVMLKELTTDTLHFVFCYTLYDLGKTLLIFRSLPDAMACSLDLGAVFFGGRTHRRPRTNHIQAAAELLLGAFLWCLLCWLLTSVLIF